MNSSLRNILMVSVAAALPLTLAAETAASSSTKPMPSETRDTSSSSSLTTPSVTPGSTSAGSIQRLNDRALENQFTAKDLIGKELYDRQGKRIGEVKDIVLASSSNPQLASNLSTKSGIHSSYTTDSTATSAGTKRTASGSVGGASATGSVTTSDNGVAVSGSTSRKGSADVSGTARDLSRRADALMGSATEDAVVVSFGGFLGAGNSLLRVPLSQLSYDASNKHITISMAESELSSLPEEKEMSRSAAE